MKNKFHKCPFLKFLKHAFVARRMRFPPDEAKTPAEIKPKQLPMKIQTGPVFNEVSDPLTTNILFAEANFHPQSTKTQTIHVLKEVYAPSIR